MKCQSWGHTSDIVNISTDLIRTKVQELVVHTKPKMYLFVPQIIKLDYVADKRYPIRESKSSLSSTLIASIQMQTTPNVFQLDQYLEPSLRGMTSPD